MAGEAVVAIWNGIAGKNPAHGAGSDQPRAKLDGAPAMRAAARKTIGRHLLGIGLFVFAAHPGRASDAAAPLVLESTIRLPDVAGRIDHTAIDLRRKRLFVAELGNGTVDVVDLSEKRVMHRISGLHEPQGIGYSSTQDVIAVASAGDGSVRLFGGEDFKPAGIAALGDDADNIRVDPGSATMLVGYGSGGIATVQLPGGAVAARAPLPAHPPGSTPAATRTTCFSTTSASVSTSAVAAELSTSSRAATGFTGSSIG